MSTPASYEVERAQSEQAATPEAILANRVRESLQGLVDHEFISGDNIRIKFDEERDSVSIIFENRATRAVFLNHSELGRNFQRATIVESFPPNRVSSVFKQAKDKKMTQDQFAEEYLRARSEVKKEYHLQIPKAMYEEASQSAAVNIPAYDSFASREEAKGAAK